MCRKLFFFNYQSSLFKGYDQYPGFLVWWEGEGIQFIYILSKKDGSTVCLAILIP